MKKGRNVVIKFLQVLAAVLSLALCLSSCKSSDPKPVVSDTPFVRLKKEEVLSSKILKTSINYAVLLPADYNTSTESYPVVYMLHGYGDNETAWYTYGNLQYYVDRNAASTVPMIYVMPRAGNRYYINKYNGNYRFMDMFVDELVPAIDSIYRTKKDKSQRAVVGYSMGGYGALILPSEHPETFSISVPLSMSFRTDEQYENESNDAYAVQWAPNFGGTGATGAARLNDYFISLSPFHYFAKSDVSQYAGLKILMDCGDDEEQLQHTNDALHVLMRDHNIAHEYRVRDGGHTFDYWRRSLEEALVFISDATKGTTYPANPAPAPIGTLVTDNDYDQHTLAGSSIAYSVLTPPGYESGTTSYPVIYFVYDADEGKDNEQRIELLSILNNNMITGTLYKALIVAIPSNVEAGAISQIVSEVDESYRTKQQNSSRALMGNGAGGQLAASILTQGGSTFNAGFLYNALLPDEGTTPGTDVYYYLDATTSVGSYKGYHSMFVAIRDQDSEYQYRVRRGDTSWQSVLNGVAQSIGYINDKLE